MWKGGCGMSGKTVEAVIPVYKPGRELSRLLKRLDKQAVPLAKIHLMHTTDGEELIGLPELETPVEIHAIRICDFDHAATRHQGFSLCQSDYILCMTQDAVPVDSHLTENLLAAFDDEMCALAYARQVARKEHGAIEQYTRCFNYPDENRVQDLSRLEELGIKTYFCSDACALYKRDLYEQLGGFEQPAIFNEDMVFAYKLIQAGHSIRYQAGARVYHSHRYTLLQQFRRNYDLGVSQAQHPEIFAAVSSTSEGKRLVAGTAKYLIRHHHFLSLPYLIAVSGSKWLGYKTGHHYRHLPSPLVRSFTMNKNYWKH